MESSTTNRGQILMYGFDLLRKGEKMNFPFKHIIVKLFSGGTAALVVVVL